MPDRQRLYWTCQLAGWGTYTAINGAFGVRTGSDAVSLGVFTVVGVAASHGLRAWIKRHRWLQRRMGQLAWRVLLASAVLAVGTELVTLPMVWLLPIQGNFTLEQRVLFRAVFSVNLSIVFLGWQLLYLGEHWVTRIRDTELRSLQLAMAAQTAELRALKSQVQPHFLFNALNSVRALIAEDPPRAQEMVTDLAAMMRYSLKARDRDTVPLGEELEAVEAYLALEGVRLEERLRVRFEIAPEARTRPVPVMLLQTLVENAVKHGIAPAEKGGEVLIAAGVEPEVLWLSVTNSREPGVGAQAPSTGVGIENARERLRLLFGTEASLALETSAPEQVVARVRIPIGSAA